MKNNNCLALSDFYDQLITNFEEEKGVLWCYMNPYPRPSFNPQLLIDLKRFLQVVKNRVNSDLLANRVSQIKYIVFASYKPGVFSLGGDLRLFLDCIVSSDKNKLTEYMNLSIDVMYSIYSNMGIPVTTISLIRGNALGAGFEGALSCDYIVAEAGVQLGFPEVLFNMFPGMGAYSFLSRKINAITVEKMIQSGRVYNAEELHETGIVDVLAEKEQGVSEVYKFIKQHEKNNITKSSILKIRNRINPVTYDELIDIGTIWVDAAMSLSSRELKVMQRLVRSQDKLAEKLLETEEGKERMSL